MVDGELGAGVVVHESEGLGALDDKVVDVHGNEINADCAEVVDREGDLELGSHTIDGLVVLRELAPYVAADLSGD